MATNIPAKTASKSRSKASAIPAKTATKSTSKASATPAKTARKSTSKAGAIPAKTASKSTSKAGAPAPRRVRSAAPAARGRASGSAAVAPAAAAATQASDAAQTFASDIGGLITQASENTLAITPLAGLRPADIANGAVSLLKVMSATPASTVRHYGRYLKTLASIAVGRSDLAPEPKDRRFADPAWKDNALYTRLMQGYVATQKELASVIDHSTLTGTDKGRAQFFASLVTDALAPSNFILGNPAAVRKIVETGGGNLVKGLQHLVEDIRQDGLMPSQVDATPFKLGENIATSPGQVVHRDEMFELLQFTPTTPQVHKRPLVMSPPQVNKYYAVDLSPEKSLIKWAVDSGVQMFVVSWRNPTVEQRHWGLEDYAMALDRAVDVARSITGSPDVNMWGTCSGGMTLAAYLGWLAAKGDRKVANTSWAVCVLDTAASLQDSALGLFASPEMIRAAKAKSRRKGYVSGEEMAKMFAWMRPNDLVWNYWVNNYLLGNKPPAFDILAWNADTTRLPGKFHCDLLDLLEKNPYVRPGTLELDGLPIDFGKVQVDAYVVGGITDHITPWKACYGTARLFGPGTTFVLANAGHLQSLVNPPGGSKSFYLAAPAGVADPQEWAAQNQATRQDGSWWPHWREWIQARSGELVDAPAKLGSRKHKPLCAAPGEYVKVR